MSKRITRIVDGKRTYRTYRAFKKAYPDTKFIRHTRRYETPDIPGLTRIRTESKKYTLHFRIDYNERSGHAFFMEDSSITNTYPFYMTHDEVWDDLESRFKEAFRQEFGGGKFPKLIDTVEGLEENGSDNPGVIIRYRYNESGEFREIKRSLGSISKAHDENRDFVRKHKP